LQKPVPVLEKFHLSGWKENPASLARFSSKSAFLSGLFVGLLALLLLSGLLSGLLALLLPGLLTLLILAALRAVLRLALVVLIHIRSPNCSKNNLNAHHPNYFTYICSSGKNISVSCQYIFHIASITALIH
jgi:hypothetical protein